MPVGYCALRGLLAASDIIETLGFASSPQPTGLAQIARA